MDVLSIYKRLLKIYGKQNWWPVKYSTKDQWFEICLGAILTQNTNWNNVEKSLENLNVNQLIDIKNILNSSDEVIKKSIKPSGYYNQKTKKIKIFCHWLLGNYKLDFNNFLKNNLNKARNELLSLWGIGPETADSILLYAGNKKIFVIDTYTKKLCNKFNITFSHYNDYQSFFEKNLKKSLYLYKEFHALIVKSGKDKHKFL